MNQAEYLVRGLGYVKSIADIEDAVVTSKISPQFVSKMLQMFI